MNRNLLRSFRSYLRIKSIERGWKELPEVKLLEVVANEWQDVPYAIIHLAFSRPWRLRFSGIELPKYDRMIDGPHNVLARALFTHLLAREMDWPYSNDPGDFEGPGGRNYRNTTQIPGCDVENLTQGNTIARRTIDSYLNYKERIMVATKELERIYEINSRTRRSREWGFGGPNINEMTGRYPNPREIILRFKDGFGLDYLAEKILI